MKNLTFQGITFANTDYGLYTVAGSHGKATVQGATVFIAGFLAAGGMWSVVYRAGR